MIKANFFPGQETRPYSSAHQPLEPLHKCCLDNRKADQYHYIFFTVDLPDIVYACYAKLVSEKKTVYLKLESYSLKFESCSLNFKSCSLNFKSCSLKCRSC